MAEAGGSPPSRRPFGRSRRSDQSDVRLLTVLLAGPVAGTHPRERCHLTRGTPCRPLLEPRRSSSRRVWPVPAGELLTCSRHSRRRGRSGGDGNRAHAITEPLGVEGHAGRNQGPRPSKARDPLCGRARLRSVAGELAGQLALEVCAGVVGPVISTVLSRWAYFVSMASRVATEEASQMCAADRSMTTLSGFGGVREPADQVVGRNEEQTAHRSPGGPPSCRSGR